MAKFTLNGKLIEAPEGMLVLEAAKRAGVEIPHYCYHPALGNPGNCRLCVVEVEGAPKPLVSCRLAVKEGLVVRSVSEAALRAQAASLEFHLFNHPLDCPVCDQAGECALQDYYMKVGCYESSVREDKRHKNKRLAVGPHVMLDQERCILCTRCTRFTEKITKTGELGIFGRGAEEFVALAPGKTLDNPYSGCVVDVCPVGALTDRDFRYQVRVWYLEKTDSVCPGCARGCSIEVHANVRRFWHNEGRRVARLKPRFNPEVNDWWICDEGRYGTKSLNSDRLGRVLRLKSPREELSWDEAFDEIAASLKTNLSTKGASGLAVIASGALCNEDWAAFKSLFVDTLGAERFLFAPEPDQLGGADELLRRPEKVPNLRGGLSCGFGERIRSASWAGLADDIQKGAVWGLYIVDRDAAKVWGKKAERLLSMPALVVFQGPNKTGVGDLAHYRLPATAYVEEEGHFTNFEGLVQHYKRALPPIGAARPDWSIFLGLRERWK